MKTLFLLFFACFIESYVVANNEPIQAGPVLVRSQKKHKNLNILNRRYLKVQDGQAGVEVKILATKKAADNNNVYTVFPPIHVKGSKVANLPDSPYFPLEKYSDYKPRVKKVLPDFLYKSAIRKKRSAAKPKSKAAVTKLVSGLHTTSHKKALKRSDKDKDDSKKDDIKEKDDNKENDDKKDKDDKKGKVEDDKKSKDNNKDKLGAKVSKTSKQPAKAKMSGKSKPANIPKLGATIKKSKSKAKPKPKTRSKKEAPKRLRSGGKKKVRSANRRRRSAKPSRRLIASNDASIDNYPYTISIQKDRQHWCSGALLNPKLAITTANCMWKADRVTRMRIRACSRYTDRGGQEARIQEVMKHPQWSIRRGPDHDLALIYLDRMIGAWLLSMEQPPFSPTLRQLLDFLVRHDVHIYSFSHKCHGVDLPNRVMYPVFEDAWITSWGAERRDGIYERPLTLQAYHANLIDRAVCNNITMRYGVGVTSNFICLAQTGRRAPCTRDTGAPAVSDGVLWGLASWGIRKLCGTERFPAMFSFTASHSNMDFISKATTYLMSEQRLHPFPDRYPFEFTRKSTRGGSGTEPTVGGMVDVALEPEGGGGIQQIEVERET